MKNYCCIAFSGMKTFAAVGKAYAHNCRRGDVPQNAENEKTYMNKELVDRDESVSFVDEIKERIKREQIQLPRRKDSTRVIEAVLSFSRKEPDMDIDAWAADSLAYLQREFGKKNVVSATLHMDETTPHIHAIILPVIDGKIQAAKALHNDKATFRASKEEKGYAHFHSTYALAMGKYGLERGVVGSVAKHENIKKLYGKLEEALNFHLPKPNHGELIEDYITRAEEELQRFIAPMAGEIEKLRRTLQRNEAVNSQQAEEIAKNNSDIARLNSEIPDEVGQIRLKNMNAILYSIDHKLLPEEETVALLEHMKQAAYIGLNAIERDKE